MEILITEPKEFSSVALEKLKKLGNVQMGPFHKNELSLIISKIDIVVIRLEHFLDSNLLKKAIRLKYILSPTTGLNHIDVAYALKRNIKIISLKNEQDFLESIPSTAEHTWALLLSLIRKVPQSFEDIKNGRWNRENFKGNNLNALTIGIFGFGRVGKQVAKIAQVFNMKIVVFDKNKIEKADYTIVNSKEELFMKSDIISIHLDLNNENIELINRDLLKLLKKGSFLINTSRGEIINETDLVEFLENKTLEGAALDVLQNENNTQDLFQSPIILYAKSNNNLILTPHIAGATKQSMLLTEEFIVDKLYSRMNNQN